MIDLRPYQREAVDAIHNAAGRGVYRAAVGLPTGTGKTIVFSKVIEERGYPALILAHRDELIEQAVDKYRRVDGAASVGVVKAERNEVGHDVTVASVQTLSRENRLAQLPDRFRTLVIDEAHHAVAPTYRRIVEGLSESPLVVGVSATLERGDGVGMMHAWDEVVYFKTLQEMIAAGYLVDVRAIQVKLRIDFRLLRVSRGDFTGASVEEALDESHACAAAARAYLDYAAGRRTIVFTPTVRTAHDMAATFEASGVPAAAVDHTTPLVERRAMLRAFSRGDVQVMANAMVLTEGFDEPAVDCVIVARPTRNRPLYVQMVGRGTRLHPGKRDLLVIDLVGNADRVDLVTLPRMFGLDPKDVEERGAVEALRTIAERTRRAVGLAAAGDLTVEGADLFDRKDVNWLHLDDGRWLLSLGDARRLYLVPTADRWTTTLSSYDRATRRGSERVLGAGLDLGYAMGIAEEEMRASGARHLVDRSASWRDLAPTPKQLSILRERGVPVAPDVTRGQASDLLSALFATR